MLKHTLLVYWLAAVSALASVSVSDLRCEYRKDPIGIDTAQPRLSWVLESKERGVLQSAYQVIVADDPQLLEKEQGNLWDSGRISSDQSAQVVYGGKSPASWQKCFWKVRVWDENKTTSAWSKPAAWTMGILNSNDWTAHWIYQDQPASDPAPTTLKPASYFRKSFTVTKPIQRAVVFASALGAYELHLNGKAVDTDVLSPGWTDFGKRVHYFGYDVTGQLQRGENVIGAILGDGWYASYIAFTGRRHLYGGDPRLIVQLRIDYEDGSSVTIGTDETWKTAFGPIHAADLQSGCEYDARAELKDWDRPFGDSKDWHPASVDNNAQANLVAHPGEPIRRAQELQTINVTEPIAGVYVFDLGQNIVGWARLTARGTAGQKIVARYAEMLNPDGTIYTTNLRKAKATDTYYLSGGKRAYEPFFTFHGFRYVEVTGLDYKPSKSDLTGITVHSDLDQTGSFECSEPLVNKLYSNSVWGQEGNFLDVPTDCPQRDERAGWTGDAQVFMKTACLNMDSAAFYTKWLVDLCEDSERPDGSFCDVAPSVAGVKGGNTGWADAAPLCNWRMFEMYGDTRAPEQHYPALVRYMQFLAQTSTNFTRNVGAYGDWLRLAGPQKSRTIGTAYYFYTARTMANIAAAIGKQDDGKEYHDLAENIRSTFVKNYIKQDGQILDDNGDTAQTYYALAFGLELVPDEMKGKVAEQFAAALHAQNDHIATGFLGTPFILFALQKAGHPELAYKLLLNKTYPSWLQQVLWGSTTMWERWDGWRPDKGFQNPGMNSFNHYWLGCVSEWLFTQVAGIDADGAGFKHIVIHPEIGSPDNGFNWVKASYRSIHGTIASQWRSQGGRFNLKVTVPANCDATVYVPAKESSAVSESGKPAEHIPGIKLLRMENGSAVFQIGSGDYTFSVK